MKIYISILHDGWVKTELMRNMVLWTRECPYDITMSYDFLQPIEHNRNTIVKHFLNTDNDFLIMIDNDNVPNKNIFYEVESDKDVISIPTPIGNGSNTFLNCFEYTNNKLIPIIERNKGLLKVDAVGTGCIIIKRKVLEKIKKPFERIFDEDGICIFGSDLNFSRKCQLEGFELYANTDIQCDHFKETNLLESIK